MPTGVRLKFPKWEECLSGLIEYYQQRIELPDSLFKDSHTLIKKVNRQKGEFTFSRASEKTKAENIDIPKALIQEVQKRRHLEANQFYTLSLSDLDIHWIDERVNSALGIPKKLFTEANLYDWDHSLILYHPMDALHVLRYAVLKDYICQLDGVIAPEQEYSFNLRFRMTRRLDKERANLEFLLVDKRRAFIYSEPSDTKTQRFYLNRWTVSNDSERHKVVVPSIEVITDAERTRFLNTLMFLFNAKHLGFSPKDILVTNYNNLYDGPEESRSSLNNALRKYHDDDHQFAVKAYTDCSYYLNKKLTTALQIHSLDIVYKSSFYVRMNRLSKANRLGLTPLPRELRDIILSKVVLA